MKADAILHNAADLVAGDRAVTHGCKRENHKNIAALWSAFLGIQITPTQAALMLALFKIARTKTGELNADDFLDMAGYSGIAGEIATEND